MEVEKAFKRLLIKNPFYGLFCLSLPKEITRKYPTICVSKNGINFQLNINPDFWEKHSDDEQLALLHHELSHIALQHMFIQESFADPKLFNIAADAEVNSYIDNLPPDGITAQFLSNKLGVYLENGLGTKKYYEALTQQQQQAQAKNPQQPCNGGKGGQGTSNNSPSSFQSPSEAAPDSPQQNPQPQENRQPSSSSPQERPQEEKERGDEQEQESQYPDGFEDFNPIDDHSTWKEFKNLSEANKQLMTNNVNNILKQTAEQVEKMRGTIPGELTELISKLREKKPEIFNWKAYFRRLLGSIYDVNIRSTRRKESKRFDGAAGIQHRKKVSILVAVDTSASVSTKELQEFFNEIDYVYKAGARVTIIECDAQINSITEYDGKKMPEIKGRGGTNFNPPVDYYKEHKKEYASLIYFTDGECELPKEHPSGMVWVITSNGLHQDFPGKAIYIPKNNPNNN